MRKVKTITKREERAFKESEVLIMLERMDDNFKVLAENLMGTNEKVDSLTEQMQSLNDKVDLMDSKITILDSKVNKLDIKVNTLDSNVSKLEKRLDDFQEETRDNFKLMMEHFYNIDDELVEIKAEIKYLKQVLNNKVDLEKLAELEKRVRALEQERMVVRDEGTQKYMR